MSSGPTLIDARQSAYAYFPFLVPDGNPWALRAANNWLVTRIQLFAAAAAAAALQLRSEPGTLINVAAGGCLCLEPNGALRSDLLVSGAGAQLIVEYWFQTRPDGSIFFPTAGPP